MPLWLTDDMTNAAPFPVEVSNAGTLFALLRDGAAQTRADLARRIGVSRTTVAAWIDQLMALGLVQPVGAAASTGGRPSSQFAFRADAAVVVAVDMGATRLRMGITDLSGRILAHREFVFDIAAGPDAVLSIVERVAVEQLGEIGRERSEVAAVGIGIPGPVEFATGRPINPPIMPGWSGFDIHAWGERVFRAPTVVDNDVNVMALGERTFAWSGVDDFLFIKVSTGIGAGTLAGGMLRRGVNGAAGDIGHAPISRLPDVTCTCGNRGCLEAIASGVAIARALRDKGYHVTTALDVVELTRSGNVDAIHAVRQAGRDIGEILTVAVALLNPAVIAIGGSLAQVAEHLIAGIREVVYSRSVPLSTENLTIVPSRVGSDAGLHGASRLASDVALSPQRVNQLLEAADAHRAAG